MRGWVKGKQDRESPSARSHREFERITEMEVGKRIAQVEVRPNWVNVAIFLGFSAFDTI